MTAEDQPGVGAAFGFTRTGEGSAGGDLMVHPPSGKADATGQTTFTVPLFVRPLPLAGWLEDERAESLNANKG